MKKMYAMLLLAAVAMIFSGCSKDNSLAPASPDDQMTPEFKFPGTYFEVTSLPGDPDAFYPGEWTMLPNGNVVIKGMVAEWYDTADTWLLTGTSLYTENWKFNVNDPTVKFWGKVELSVEGDDGVWQGSWHGYGTFLGDPPYDFWLSDLAVDKLEITYTGHGGSVDGMVAKATYSIDTSVEFQWYGEGYYK